MTREEAWAIQDKLARDGYRLEWWYGTGCKQCCGVYPKAVILGGFQPRDFYYQCEVCGKRTEAFTMPWQAKEAWNNGEFVEGQISLF